MTSIEAERTLRRSVRCLYEKRKADIIFEYTKTQVKENTIRKGHKTPDQGTTSRKALNATAHTTKATAMIKAGSPGRVARVAESTGTHTTHDENTNVVAITAMDNLTKIFMKAQT